MQSHVNQGPALRLVLASNNAKKLKELREILAEVAPELTLQSSSELGLSEPVEDGDDFYDNAFIKAASAWRELHARGERAVVLADDSGLEVDALNGAPGVNSARYAGEGGDAANTAKLLENMTKVPEHKRNCRYRCVIAVAVPASLEAAAGSLASGRSETLDEDAGSVHFAAGSVEGRVLTEARGEGGFGYDPVVLYPPANQTFAELSAEQKHAISHRGKALAEVKPFLAALVRLLRSGL